MNLPSRQDIWWSTRAALWQSPIWHKFYEVVLRLRSPELRAVLTRPTSDVCVEAFPRSANTFLVEALRLRTKEPIKIAHHLHDFIQVHRAIKFGVPVVIILREPLDAFISFKLKFPKLDLRTMHRVYMSFYAAILQHSQYCRIVLYEDVVTRPEMVIGRIHDWLGLDPVPGLRLDRDAVFDAIDEAKRKREGEAPPGNVRFATSLARPTAEKEMAKAEVRSAISRELGDLLGSAQRLHSQLREKAQHFGDGQF